MPNDIKQFIDFFHNSSVKIRKQKPIFIRGKDGNLVKLALNVFSRQQLEMLALWFLEKKRKMSPTIGAMLSAVVLEELQDVIRNPHFWKDLDAIHEHYFKNIPHARVSHGLEKVLPELYSKLYDKKD